MGIRFHAYARRANGLDKCSTSPSIPTDATLDPQNYRPRNFSVPLPLPIESLSQDNSRAGRCAANS